MEAAAECIHCRVVMTSWSAPGSQIRYYQCPFCQRTHSSLYGEVFRNHAGARMLGAPARPAGAGVPTASPEEVRWARVKATAARWFARLEAEERRSEAAVPRVRALRPVPQQGPARHARKDDDLPEIDVDDGVPEIDPGDVVEVAAAVSSGRARRA
jgi:hypothetical protein